VPRICIDYDHVPGPDEPTEVELGYDEMDEFIVHAMARSGDQGAIDFINSLDESLT
jgi:hypothetical protein